MTDNQCIAIMATIMRSVLVLADALTRKSPLDKPQVQLLTDHQAVDYARELLGRVSQGEPPA